jgi:hypothetical protein
VLDWIYKPFIDSLPNAIGALIAAALLAVITYFYRRRSRRKDEELGQKLINELIESNSQNKFSCAGNVARTNEDEAGLVLISEIIRKKASQHIKVIGRGPQWIDPRIKEYLSSVAKAIIRGVEYSRILILDKDLPQNGLVWLLLVERFVAQLSYRGKVALYIVKMDQSQSLVLQFQIVDDTYLHRINRYYLSKEAGASRRANSLFAIAPHADIDEHIAIFEQHLKGRGLPVSHREIVEVIQELLTTIDPANFVITLHWRLVFQVVDFLNSLDVEKMPPKGFEFIGSLMPFTFTFEAAQRFAKERRESTNATPVIVVPFERLSDAMTLFEQGKLDHICLPVANTRIDQLSPPTLGIEELERFKEQYSMTKKLELEVSFCLAGKPPKSNKIKAIAAVDAAYTQVQSELSKKVLSLPRVAEDMQSNYHAAWAASQHADVAAITTHSAATFFGLHSYNSLGLEDNFTTFSIYSRKCNQLG